MDFITKISSTIQDGQFLEIVGLCAVLYALLSVSRRLIRSLSGIYIFPPKRVTVPLEKEEISDKLDGYPKFDPNRLVGEKDTVYYWDPSTYG